MIRIPLKVKANLLTQEELVTIASGSSNSIKVKFDIDPNSDFADSTLTKKAIFRYYQGSYFISDVDANGEVYVPKFVIAYPYFKVALRAESENATVVVTTNEIQVPVEKSPVFYETTITDGDVTIRNLDGTLNVYKAGDVTFIDFTTSYKTAVDAVIAGTYATASALNSVASDVSLIKDDIINMSNSISDLQGDIQDLDTTKQDTLVSGESIKTINGTSLLGSGNYAFDSAFDEESTNALQNKIISKEVKELNYELAVLREAVFEVVLSEIDYTSVFTDSFTIPDTLTDTDGTHRVVFSETELKKVSGNSVVANQLVKNGNFVDTSNWLVRAGTFNTQNNIGTLTQTLSSYANYIGQKSKIITGHKYFVSIKVKKNSLQVTGFALGTSIGWTTQIQTFIGKSDLTSTFETYNAIITSLYDNSRIIFGISNYVGDVLLEISFADLIFADLTQMFGSGNEPTSVDDVRIQWLIKYLENNPDYDVGTIKSSIINGLQSLDSNDEVIGTIAIPPTEIKSAGTAQDYIEVVEGDIVEGEQLYNLVKITNVGMIVFDGNTDLTKWLKVNNTAGTYTSFYLSRDNWLDTYGLETYPKIVPNTQTKANMIANILETKATLYLDVDSPCIWGYTDGSVALGITPPNTIRTKSDFKNWLTSNPLTIVYELATPTQATIATNLHFSEISMLIAEGGKIKPLYDNVPVDTTLTFVVKKAISE